MFLGMEESASRAASRYSASLTKNFASIEEGMKRSLIGTTRTVADRIEKYSKTGLDYFEFKFVYSTIKEFHEMMKLFADDVMSRFR